MSKEIVDLNEVILQKEQQISELHEKEKEYENMKADQLVNDIRMGINQVIESDKYLQWRVNEERDK